MGAKKRRRSMRIQSKTLHDSSSDPEFQKTMSVIDKLSKKYKGSSSYDADTENAGNSTSSSKKSTVQMSASSSLYDFSDDFTDSPFSGNIVKTYIKPRKTKAQLSNKKKVQEGKKKFAVIASHKQHRKKEQKMNANVKKTENAFKKAVVKRIKGSPQKVSTPVTQNFKAAAIKSSIKKSQVLSPIENSHTPVGNGEQNKSVSFCFKSPEIQPVRRKGNQPCNTHTNVQILRACDRKGSKVGTPAFKRKKDVQNKSVSFCFTSPEIQPVRGKGKQPHNTDTNVQILRACDRKGSKVGTPAFKRKKDVQDENSRETRSAKKIRLVQDTAQPQSYTFLDKSSEANSDHCDSGVFVSPILTKLKAKEKNAPKLPLSKLEAKESSTPVVKAVTNKHSRQSNSRFIFKPAHSSSVLMPSPVPRVETSLSDYSSMEVEESMFSLEEAEKPSTSAEGVVEVQPIPIFNLSSSSEEEVLNVNRSYKSYKRSQKKICVGRYSISKVEAWADKINSQFDEIDKYELSIEG